MKMKILLAVLLIVGVLLGTTTIALANENPTVFGDTYRGSNNFLICENEKYTIVMQKCGWERWIFSYHFYRIMRVDKVTGEAIELLRETEAIRDLVVIDDVVYYLKIFAKNQNTELFRVNLDGTEKTRICGREAGLWNLLGGKDDRIYASTGIWGYGIVCYNKHGELVNTIQERESVRGFPIRDSKGYSFWYKTKESSEWIKYRIANDTKEITSISANEDITYVRCCLKCYKYTLF